MQNNKKTKLQNIPKTLTNYKIQKQQAICQNTIIQKPQAKHTGIQYMYKTYTIQNTTKAQIHQNATYKNKSTKETQFNIQNITKLQIL